MSVFTVVANGQDTYAAYLGLFGGGPLDTRIASYLGDYDQALSIAIDDKSRLFTIWGGTYPFQATIRLDTLRSPAGVEAVAERVRLAVTRATGYIPSAVSVVSAGQPVPPVPDAGVLDKAEETVFDIAGLLRKLANGLGTTIETAQWVLIAVGVGLVALVYFIATKPGSAARIVRG